MVTFLITSFFIIGFLAVALYLWQKPRSEQTELLPPKPDPRSLFPTEDLEESTTVESQKLSGERRTEILELARSGSNSALDEANKFQDSDLYEEVLNSLAAGAEGPQLLSLVSYVSTHGLRVTKNLAQKFIESWRQAPTRNSFPGMLHIAALSDDARIYRTAVEAVMQCWRDGGLAGASAAELRSVIDGEFWVISSQERSSGAGFLLKQTMSEARRELEPAKSESTLPT